MKLYHPADLDFSGAVPYHMGRFPPTALDYTRLARQISNAATALARYDGVLRSLPNNDVLLAPLRRQEAVVSSRIEGTVATLDEVLQFEAEEDDGGGSYRQEVIEVFSYTRALNHAQKLMNEGLPICGRLIKQTHSKLLFTGRGADKQPGEFKDDQNYVIDGSRRKVLFVPISHDQLADHFRTFEDYANNEKVEPLVQTAISHLEFEALHPFKDGNGRVGRMLITLMLWNKGLITQPHFYISSYLENRRDEYIDRMRAVSSNDEWTEWCLFFLAAIEDQAHTNLRIAENIRNLYEEMKERFREALRSQYTTAALDFIFSRPVFRNSTFLSRAGIPRPTAGRFSRILAEQNLLTTIEPGSGRRSAVYAFEPLLRIVRD